MFFEYGKAETDYLSAKDKRLGAVIERIGHIERAVDDDLFSSIVHHIIGQQVSTKAQRCVWERMQRAYGTVTARVIATADRDELQALGTTYRKVDYVQAAAGKIESGAFDLDAVAHMSDAEAIEALTSLDGVGTWTAEMLLLFGLQRPDILSYGDLGIVRGMRMVYRHRTLSRERFERYRHRFSPHGSVASLYFWAVAGGAIPEPSDPAKPQPRKPGGAKRNPR